MMEVGVNAVPTMTETASDAAQNDTVAPAESSQKYSFSNCTFHNVTFK